MTTAITANGASWRAGVESTVRAAGKKGVPSRLIYSPTLRAILAMGTGFVALSELLQLVRRARPARGLGGGLPSSSLSDHRSLRPSLRRGCTVPLNVAASAERARGATTFQPYDRDHARQRVDRNLGGGGRTDVSQ